MKVAQLCPTLYSAWDSPGQNTGVRSLSLLQGNLPNPGIEPRSPTLQADSLQSEPPGKPKNTGVGSLSLLQGNLPNPGIKLESPALQKDSLPAELPGKALQLTSYSNLNGRSSPWYWRDSTYSFFLWDGQNLLFDVSQLPSPASIMTSWCFLLLSSQIPKES